MASGPVGKRAANISRKRQEQQAEESSESDNETEPAKSFHRRLSTNRDIKRAGAVKEGFLMKQTSSFNRWRRRYFKIRGSKLYYAKNTKAAVFDEIELREVAADECIVRNVSHSFQVITPFRRLVLCAESKEEMDEWMATLRSAAAENHSYETGDQHDFLSGQHHWYATSHARPTYCNVCREALSGVTSHGLSCEICKCKVHKRCAAKAISNCKWTTLASVGKDIIEDAYGTITMPHQWMEGNLPVSAKCAVCDKTCGSVLRLQDWRCLWCRATVHTACRPSHPVKCPLGPARVSTVPPTALHSIEFNGSRAECGFGEETEAVDHLLESDPINSSRMSHSGTDEAWEAIRPQGCSPLLVFVNSKSGDNQGVKFLRRFKQLLNPAQVFDLIGSGPGLGLRLFRHFDPFRILVCSGDGSVGWVMSEIDRLNMHKQCQVGVLPLGTGNDLARVLGWGASCDDDAQLPQLLDKYEKACTKILDRWSVMAFERNISLGTSNVLMSSQVTPSLSSTTMAAYEDSVLFHITKILQSDQHSVVINSAKVLCETVKDFTIYASETSFGRGDEEFGCMLQILREKLDLLLQTLGKEQETISSDSPVEDSEISMCLFDGDEKSTLEKSEKDTQSKKKKPTPTQRQQLMLRANSLKKAVRKLVEHTENAIDEQNKQKGASTEPEPPSSSWKPMDTLKAKPMSTIDSINGSSVEVSPCPSPTPSILAKRLTTLSPLPDLRRDSGGEELLTLPVPKEFADRRRSSALSVEGMPDCSVDSDSSHTTSLVVPVPNDMPADRPPEKKGGATADMGGVKRKLCAGPPAAAGPLSLVGPATELVSSGIGTKVRRAGTGTGTDDPVFLGLADDPNRRSSFGGFSLDSHDSDTFAHEFLKCSRPAQARHSVDSGEDPVWRCFVPSIEAGEIADIKHIDSSETSEESGDMISLAGRKAREDGEPVDDNDEDDPRNGVGLSGHAQYRENETDPAIQCTLAHFVEGSDIARRSFKCRHVARSKVIVSPRRVADADAFAEESVVTDKEKTCCNEPLALDELDDDLLPCTSIGNLSDEIDSYLQSMRLRKEANENQVMDETKALLDVANTTIQNILNVPEMSGRSSRSLSVGGISPATTSTPASGGSTASSTGCLFPDGSDVVQIQIEGSNSNLTTNTDDAHVGGGVGSSSLAPPSPYRQQRRSIAASSATYQQKEKVFLHAFKSAYKYFNRRRSLLLSGGNKSKGVEFSHPTVRVVVDPPSPTQSEEGKEHHGADEDGAAFRRYSCDSGGSKLLTASPTLLWRCSPAASRRISSVSLLKVPAEQSEDSTTGPPRGPFRDRLRSSVERDLEMNISLGLTSGGGANVNAGGVAATAEPTLPDPPHAAAELTGHVKRLPIINPLVRLPTWPNVSAAGMISKALLANADALCAAASPLMDPDETLLEGFFERCVMNNYFGIGIDAKISLDFHHKREEHPEKCRSRAKNYIWYGFLGSKQLLQKTYKNLEQRVQLECDGQKIPLPSLQGIVILNIPSFMGGTNFWGGTKEDECFLAPSFDDRILEVVAVFGSVQMAASRLINLQHHRIAQCQTVQINILGDEGVPIQVDGEAWVQPPGMIRIIHKNRMQMLCRNRALESSLRAWEEKQRLMNTAPQLSTSPPSGASSGTATGIGEHAPLGGEEIGLLLGFIEASTTLVKCVKLLTIRHPSIEADLYDLAMQTNDQLENVHPGGKLLPANELRPAATRLVVSARHLHEESCSLLREKAQNLRLREDLENQLSVALANMEAELRKCNMDEGYVQLQQLPPEENERKGRGRGLFWLKLRKERSRQTARDVATWGTAEVASWLEHLQLGEYVESFISHDIRGRELLSLARRDLKELGVHKVGHVKRILHAVSDLNS